MPVPYLKKLHEKTGKSMTELETLWDECKRQATAADKDKKHYWPYVVFLLKKRLGLTESLSFLEFIELDSEPVELLPALPLEAPVELPPEPLPEPAEPLALTVRNLVSGLFHIRDQAHALHLAATTFSAHVALGELYDAVISHADKIAEVAQGKYGPMNLISANGAIAPSVASDPKEFIAAVAAWIESAHSFVPAHDTFLHNLVDEVQAMIYQAKYKLERLA